MKLHVEVTAEDIAIGQRECSDGCPIALALHRLPGVQMVYVDDAVIRVDMDDGSMEGGTPQEASNFIALFDACQVVEPFAFDVEVELPEADDWDDNDDAEVSP